MCGIVGYIGPRNATPIILGGLKRLEYRGYDSAGVAVLQNGSIEVRREAGKLSNLTNSVQESPLSGQVGIGHPRWATHGAPSQQNAHPHLGQTGKVVVVHNGIVENFLELRDELSAEGVDFKSETDSETIVHLVEHYMASGLDMTEAARATFKQIEGANVVVVMSTDEPDKIVTAVSAMLAAWSSAMATMAKCTPRLTSPPFLSIHVGSSSLNRGRWQRSQARVRHMKPLTEPSWN